LRSRWEQKFVMMGIGNIMSKHLALGEFAPDMVVKAVR